VEAAGIEDGQGEQSFDVFGAVLLEKSERSATPGEGAVSVSQSQNAPDCHTVTAELTGALQALDAGRVDLARKAIERAIYSFGGGGDPT
jgi:hypothetical protein